jgi:hypothetical protein
MKKVQTCEPHDCPVDCFYSQWTDWTECRRPGPVAYSADPLKARADCGPGGQKTRTRVLLHPAEHNGRSCSVVYGNAADLGAETVNCTMDPCAEHCTVTDFPLWSDVGCMRGGAAVTCGGGLKTRTRSIINEANYGGDSCPHLKEQASCATDPCPIDCELEANWYTVHVPGTEDDCTAPCGGGQKTSRKAVIRHARFGGVACQVDEYIKIEACNAHGCPIDCKLGDWEEWNMTDCSALCGGGQVTRSRPKVIEAAFLGKECDATLMTQTMECNTQPCPIDCVSSYGAWSRCSKTCGDGGNRFRLLDITRFPLHGGNPCPAIEESQQCTRSHYDGDGVKRCKVPGSAQIECEGNNCVCEGDTCPEDCVLGDWDYPEAGDWGDCLADVDCNSNCEIVTCNDGTNNGGKMKRTRTVTSPARYGGKSCGQTEQTKTCNTQRCPINCVVSEWNEHYNACSKTCGDAGAGQPNGVRRRTRNIEVMDAYGGTVCGSAEHDTEIFQVVGCGSGSCPEDCTVGEWSTYDATKCLKSDGNPATCADDEGTWNMTRQILEQYTNHTDEHGNVTSGRGDKCDAKLVETKPCKRTPCVINCVQVPANEMVVSQCSKTCGSGTQTRTRPIITHPAHGGTACEIYADQLCNTGRCPTDCVEDPWHLAEKGDCNATCGGGWQLWERNQTDPQTGYGEVRTTNELTGVVTSTIETIDGKACGPKTKEVRCNTHNCAIDCQYTGYSEWVYSATCGANATMTRYRSISRNGLFGGELCDKGSLIDSQPANLTACPVDCVPDAWEDNWTNCSAACAGGTQTRERYIKPSEPVGHVCPFASRETRDCNMGPCPVNCVTGYDGVANEWSAPTACTKTCGGGVQYRTKSVITPPAHGGGTCGDLVESLDCGLDACPVDCRLGAWSDWTDCTLSCGKGTHKRTRLVMESPSSDGVQCTATEQTAECNVNDCPIDCEQNAWGDPTTCNARVVNGVFCGGGYVSKRRTTNKDAAYGGKPCAPMTMTEECGVIDCPINCVLSGWGSWGECRDGSQTAALVHCDGGMRYRTKVKIIRAFHGGIDCLASDMVEEEACNPQACPVDCEVSKWNGEAAGEIQYSSCSRACGGGTQYTHRSILNGGPAFGGAPCPNTRMYRACPYNPCPVDCSMNSWTIWSTCSEACGKSGTQTRTRQVRVHAAHNGTACNFDPGSNTTETQEQACYNGHCPVDCTVSNWTITPGVCTSGCGPKKVRWTREITVRNSNGGDIGDCTGPFVKEEDCGLDPCPIDCKYGFWENKPGAVCTAACGTGTIEQQRQITRQSDYDGVPCTEALERSTACSQQPCPVDCELSYTDWGFNGIVGACSQPCGNGSQHRFEHFEQRPRNGGKTCDEVYPDRSTTRSCNEFACTTSPTAYPTSSPTSAPTAFPTALPTNRPTEYRECVQGQEYNRVLQSSGKETALRFPGEGPWELQFSFSSDSATTCDVKFSHDLLDGSIQIKQDAAYNTDTKKIRGCQLSLS